MNPFLACFIMVFVSIALAYGFWAREKRRAAGRAREYRAAQARCKRKREKEAQMAASAPPSYETQFEDPCR